MTKVASDRVAKNMFAIYCVIKAGGHGDKACALMVADNGESHFGAKYDADSARGAYNWAIQDEKIVLAGFEPHGLKKHGLSAKQKGPRSKVNKSAMIAALLIGDAAKAAKPVEPVEQVDPEDQFLLEGPSENEAQAEAEAEVTGELETV